MVFTCEVITWHDAPPRYRRVFRVRYEHAIWKLILIRCNCWIIHCLFIIHYLLFIIHYPLSIIHCLSFIVQIQSIWLHESIKDTLSFYLFLLSAWSSAENATSFTEIYMNILKSLMKFLIYQIIITEIIILNTLLWEIDRSWYRVKDFEENMMILEFIININDYNNLKNYLFFIIISKM